MPKQPRFDSLEQLLLYCEASRIFCSGRESALPLDNDGEVNGCSKNLRSAGFWSAFHRLSPLRTRTKSAQCAIALLDISPLDGRRNALCFLSPWFGLREVCMRFLCSSFARFVLLVLSFHRTSFAVLVEVVSLNKKYKLARQKMIFLPFPP